MKTPRVHPAHSLEIVVSDDQVKRTVQIAANGPGHVVVRVAGPQTSGWIRMVLTTESEQHLVDLEVRLRQGLDLHLIHCEDRVLARSRGGKTQTRASVPLDTLDTLEDLAIAYTPRRRPGLPGSRAISRRVIERWWPHHTNPRAPQRPTEGTSHG